MKIKPKSKDWWTMTDKQFGTLIKQVNKKIESGASEKELLKLLKKPKKS